MTARRALSHISNARCAIDLLSLLSVPAIVAIHTCVRWASTLYATATICANTLNPFFTHFSPISHLSQRQSNVRSSAAAAVDGPARRSYASVMVAPHRAAAAAPARVSERQRSGNGVRSSAGAVSHPTIKEWEQSGHSVTSIIQGDPTIPCTQSQSMHR